MTLLRVLVIVGDAQERDYPVRLAHIEQLREQLAFLSERQQVIKGHYCIHTHMGS